MIKHIIAALFVAAVVALQQSAIQANPTFAKTPACVNSGVVSFASAPTNGDIVIGTEIAGLTLSGATMKDSNSVSYTQEISTGTTSAFVGLWDAIVSGSPTASYTFSASTSGHCIYDITGIVNPPGTYQSNSTASLSGTTMVLTIPGVKAGDAMLCGATSVGSAVTIASNNGTVTADFSSGVTKMGHWIATSTTSTTCTATATTGSNIAMMMTDYTAPPLTYPGAGMVGDAMFEVFLADLSKAA